MSKSASERRRAKLSVELCRLHREQRAEFVRIWSTYLQGWVAEVRFRARAHRELACDAHIPAVFDVWRQACQLIQAAGLQADRNVVGGLAVLEHECSKAIAGLMRLGDQVHGKPPMK